MKILYIYPYEFWGKPSISIIFNRISNYLNSKKELLNEPIDEEYLDLRIENLPEFIPENIENYRFALEELIGNIYHRFKFDLVAISCYSSFNYINTVEVTYLIKTKINPDCIIIVGGVHATMCPEDFQPKNFPEYIYDTYQKEITPFDFLIKEEGELSFFKLIKNLINNEILKRQSLNEQCIVIEPDIIEDLNELPMLELSLYKKYKQQLIDYDSIWLDFSRGCSFRCKYCPNSENYINCYKNVRLKSIEKCIEELNFINNLNWLPIKYVFITDMIFLPKKSKREEFFNKLPEVYKQNGEFKFQIHIMDRIDICSESDLENYKKLNLIPNIGLESCSNKLLYRMGKVLGKNKIQIKKGIEQYLYKAETVIKKANELDLPIIFNYLIGLPGSDKETIDESRNFFLSKRFEGKSLIETYNIILKINKYFAYFGSDIYNNAEGQYGTVFYYKKWWKIFDKDQAYYAALVDPSKDLSFNESIDLNLKFIRQIWKMQNKLGNPYYSFYNLLKRKEESIQNYKLFNLIKTKSITNFKK